MTFLLCVAPSPLRAMSDPWKPPGITLEWTRLRQIELEIKTYVDLVDRYAGGEREKSAAEMAGWNMSELRGPFESFLGLARHVPDWDLGARRARLALMLHTDAARLLSANSLDATLQEDAARALAREFAAHPTLGPFILRWFLARACEAQSQLHWLDALAWANRGLESFENDVELRLVVASIEEVLASQTAAPSPDSVFDGAGGQARTPVALGRTSREHLARARKALLSVTKQKPRRTDVHLRLARVEWRLGRYAEARRTFEALMAEATEEDAYLAHLFYGQLLEDQGELEAAAREYSRAVALDPQGQAARLALSHVRSDLGAVEEARRQVELALEPATGRQPLHDAFWRYHWGPSVRFAGLLAQLRDEVTR